ncbi:MAG: protein-L-isoaspartate(D-aspartate) O-methyltransferase [Acetobacteraceae bacterium]
MDPCAAMLRAIEVEARATARRTGRAHVSAAVLAALAAVRREAFVPANAAASAYANHPLPIGHGQTISQPFIVALMTDLLDVQAEDEVLEVGTGSGYHTAVLARLARQVWSVEVVPALAARARTALAAEGAANVYLRTGDGAAGWPEAAPFDRIIVTAAAVTVPEALVTQLRAPGRMVIPVGAPGEAQDLRLIEKDTAGMVRTRSVLDVAFVPLVADRPAGPWAGGS